MTIGRPRRANTGSTPPRRVPCYRQKCPPRRSPHRTVRPETHGLSEGPTCDRSRTMIRTLPTLLCLLAVLAAPLAAARAQFPLALPPAAPTEPAKPATPAAPTPAAPTPSITPEQARQALDV